MKQSLARSDQISRVANHEMQGALADRDDQIAALRADVAFYERLVGATAPRKGLAVHSAQFSREPGGTWRYRIVLTQTRNRDAVSLGELQFAVEGVQGGQLARSTGTACTRPTPRPPRRTRSAISSRCAAA